jgi:hypothetical protein
MHIAPSMVRGQPLGRTLSHARPGKVMHRATTREPGDLPASGRSCLTQGVVEARYLPSSDDVCGGGRMGARVGREGVRRRAFLPFAEAPAEYR